MHPHDLIRVAGSARYMHAKEIKFYEKEIAETQKR